MRSNMILNNLGRYYSKCTVKTFWELIYKEMEDKRFDKNEKDKYNHHALILLNDYKAVKEQMNDTQKLQVLQRKMEDLTSKFDESSIFNETPNLIKLLVGKDLISAKTFIYKRLPDHIYNSKIHPLGPYTLEAIIIYVLGLLYNCIQESSVVRVSTLVDRLDGVVRGQVLSMVSSTETSSGVDSGKDIKQKKGAKYNIGKELLEFMIERKLIHIELMLAEEKGTVVKGKAYRERHLFAVCDFDLSLIPLKLNLPMVCKPLNWEHITEKVFFWDDELKTPLVLSDMIGGYLSSPTSNIYDGYCPKAEVDINTRFSLITSRNLRNFNIEIALESDGYKALCGVLNGLQNVGFKVNKNLLEFIKKNRATLENVGLLMPGILAHVNLKQAYDLIRTSYFQNPEIQKLCTLDALLKEFALRVQNARYEDFIIRLASAYDDYVFYLPTFLDFRGRIYRSGILNFHERDFAKSLIVFANGNQEEGSKQSAKDIVATSAAFKYRKFNLYSDALKWYKENSCILYASSDSLISFAKEASDPFQFIAKVLCYDRVKESFRTPISKDATASAYQIMSYFLLNEDMARRTNLIPHPDGQIQDVYAYLTLDLKEFLHQKINDKFKMEIIESKLDRKLIKAIFMPMVYGKTLISMGKDIRMKYGSLLSLEDSANLAKLCTQFWSHKYPDIVNFMKLISLISWFCAEMDRAVVYSIPYFTTRQDYKSFTKDEISVYERTTKKRRRVTLKVPSMNRDKRKTKTSACANFIHQKDAYIAMKVVELLLRKGAPIYTVHDNFITTEPYTRIVPDIYINVFIQMGSPLQIINEFIRENLIKPYIGTNIETPLYSHNERCPMPSSDLKEFLMKLSPTTGQWEPKVSDFVMYYNKYVDAVWGNQVIYDNSPFLVKNEKWIQFQILLQKHLENRSHNYSVHY